MIKNRFLPIMLLIGISFAFGKLSAQDNAPDQKWRFKISGKPVKSNSSIGNTLWHANAQAGFFPNRHLETGISIGLHQEYKLSYNSNNDLYLGKDNRLRFEAIANLHLLPFLIDGKSTRLDFYLAGKSGILIFKMTDNSKKARLGFFLGAGAAYYLTRHIGIFAEYGYRKSFKSNIDNQADFMGGIAIKF